MHISKETLFATAEFVFAINARTAPTLRNAGRSFSASCASRSARLQCCMHLEELRIPVAAAPLYNLLHGTQRRSVRITAAPTQKRCLPIEASLPACAFTRTISMTRLVAQQVPNRPFLPQWQHRTEVGCEAVTTTGATMTTATLSPATAIPYDLPIDPKILGWPPVGMGTGTSISHENDHLMSPVSTTTFSQ
ncbi:hypothetical protein GQ600_7395 [Phytophthora cactorum]|nr:hypothetical protein GQ600_7395 [Phytophthora cactorum]